MLKGRNLQLLIAFSLAGIAALAAGVGTFATSNDTRAVTGTIDSAAGAAVIIEVNDEVAADSTFVNVTDMLPGDQAVRVIKLENVGEVDWESGYVSLYVADPAGSSLLNTDRFQGLQFTVERCTSFGGTGPHSYTCSAVDPTPVVAYGPITRSTLPLGSTPALTVGDADYLKFTFHLPDFADASFENLSSDITIRFTAVQRNPVTL